MTDYEIVWALDHGQFEVTTFEADVLETLLKRWPQWPPHWPTPKQRAVLRQMAERYLPSYQVAEWLGQERLL